MVDRQIAARVRDEYPWASWALWDDRFPDRGCVETTPTDVADYIVQRHDRLTSNVVLTGLNRSEDLPAPFVNFHSPSGSHFDHRLKAFIQDGDLDRLHGAYMTDLVDDVDPDSSRVEVSESDAEVFTKQLRLLDQPEFHVICFGTKPFQALIDYLGVGTQALGHEIMYATGVLDDVDLHTYRVWFYGNYGANQEKVEILERQLRYLNERIDQ